MGSFRWARPQNTELMNAVPRLQLLIWNSALSFGISLRTQNPPSLNLSSQWRGAFVSKGGETSVIIYFSLGRDVKDQYLWVQLVVSKGYKIVEDSTPSLLSSFKSTKLPKDSYICRMPWTISCPREVLCQYHNTTRSKDSTQRSYSFYSGFKIA